MNTFVNILTVTLLNNFLQSPLAYELVSENIPFLSNVVDEQEKPTNFGVLIHSIVLVVLVVLFGIFLSRYIDKATKLVKNIGK